MVYFRITIKNVFEVWFLHTLDFYDIYAMLQYAYCLSLVIRQN